MATVDLVANLLVAELWGPSGNYWTAMGPENLLAKLLLLSMVVVVVVISKVCSHDWPSGRRLVAVDTIMF